MLGFNQNLGQDVLPGDLHVVRGLSVVGVQGGSWDEVVVEILLEQLVVEEHGVALEDGERESVQALPFVCKL